MSEHKTDLVVRARPIRAARIANTVAVVVFAVFVVVALLMRRDNAGATFGHLDQVFTVGLGVLAACGFHLLTRPRLYADRTAVRTRGFIGTWRIVPWDVIVAVEFPKSVRFARLRMPGEETLAIYAVQRGDKEHAVAAMRGLRELFAITHPEPERSAGE
jgi:PH (Pleckstrin Homology) domain-containing protein